ncbi:MAG: hypothetical protein AYK23_04165 [Candidatus Proteinoplasmatales archaeon SG8-5]|nr:MAG: hypothetical protein AYK23_04165 [Candidatus Proteinoplasmatales archaeon SG8-5]
MYADLESIEARGKRKKEKRKKDGFSLFGKKEGQEEPGSAPTKEPEPESEMIELVESEEQAGEDETVTIGETGETRQVEEQTAPRIQETERNGMIQLETQEPAERSEPSEVPEDISEVIPKKSSDQEDPGPEPPGTVVVEEGGPEHSPGETKKEPSLEDSRFYKRDIYAAIDQIEQRGKRVKGKRSGLFVKSEKTETSPVVMAEPEPAPAPERRAPQSERDAIIQEVTAEEPEPVQAVGPPPEPETAADTKPEPAPVMGVSPEPAPEPQWEPLTGRKLRRAEDELLAYKRHLDKGFRSGKLTKEHCVSMVREKEIELGLRPPE